MGARMHPGWEHCLQHRAAPFAVSDIVSDRVWQSTEAAVLMRPYWGRQYQFAIPIYNPAIPTMFWAWVFARSGRDFTERHRRVAQLVRPVLSQVSRHHAAALPYGIDDRGAPAPRLTDRERVILRLLDRGQTADRIGHWLNISPRTVHKHVEHLYRKLEVHDRREAVQRALALGMLDPAGTSARA
jgi:DNA-binding CsgD family transcriptional regulator